MVVEARHLNLFPSQLIPNKDMMNPIKGNGDLYKYPDWVWSAVIHWRSDGGGSTTDILLCDRRFHNAIENLRHEVRNGEAAENVSPVSLITVTECHPRLSIKTPNGEDAIKFYVAILSVVELECETNLKRKANQKPLYIYNAKLKLGSFTFLVTESASVVDSSNGEVLADGGFKQGVNLLLTVADVDATVSKVVQAGAVAVGEIKMGGAFFGDEQRWAQIKDPFGICWFFVTPIEKKATVLETLILLNKGSLTVNSDTDCFNKVSPI